MLMKPMMMVMVAIMTSALEDRNGERVACLKSMQLFILLCPCHIRKASSSSAIACLIDPPSSAVIRSAVMSPCRRTHPLSSAPRCFSLSPRASYGWRTPSCCSAARLRGVSKCCHGALTGIGCVSNACPSVPCCDRQPIPHVARPSHSYPCIITNRGLPTTAAEEGKLLNSTYEQRYIWWLGLFLILFNDPLFPLSIDSPTIELAGFTAFSTVTFMASLLTYWLVQFDLARLQAERGRGGEINPSDYWNNPVGTCFWLPKVLFASIFWTISLAAYMWQRIMQLTDPAYDITNQSPEIKKWFTTFVAILISFYLLYLFALMVLSCRLYRTMRLANRFVLSITFLTVLMCMIGIFLQAFSPYRSDSALLLTAYGAPNLFVWFLMFAFIPAPKAPHFIVQMLAHGEHPDSLARGGVNADDELYTADTRGVLGGHHDEEDEEHVHGGEEGIDVNVDQGMEDGDGMDGSSGAAAMPKQRGGRRAQPAAAAPAVAAASKQKPGVRGNGQGRAAVAVPASAAGAGKGRARQVPVVVVDDHDGHNDNYDSDYHNGDGGQDAHVADNQFAIQDDGDEGEMDQEAAAAVVPPPVPVRAKPTAAVVSTATTAGAVKQQRPKAASVAGSGKASAFTAPTAKAASGGSSRASAGAGNPFAPSAAVSTASPSSASSAQAEAKPGPSSNPFAQAPQQQPKQHILAAQEEDEYVEREEREEDDRHDNGDDDGQHRKADGGYERDEEVAAEEEADDDDDAGEVQVNIAAAAAAPPPAPAPRQPAAAGAAGKGSKKAGRR